MNSSRKQISALSWHTSSEMEEKGEGSESEIIAALDVREGRSHKITLLIYCIPSQHMHCMLQ